MKFKRFAWCLLLLAEGTCMAQMYTVTDLGTVRNGDQLGTTASGINDSGQVVGDSNSSENGSYTQHAFRTAPNKPINPATDDFGPNTSAAAINSSGQVVGVFVATDAALAHAFRTVPNGSLNRATDDLGTLHLDTGRYDNSFAYNINNSGQVVGSSFGQSAEHAFRTAPNRPINPDTDDIGRFPGDFAFSRAQSINSSGQVVGVFVATDTALAHAFRTAPNRPINPATDDLGTLNLTTGDRSEAHAINSFGQVVGLSYCCDEFYIGHAFRTGPNRPIDPTKDDLGVLQRGSYSLALGIDDFGQVVGFSTLNETDPYSHAFVYNGVVMHDLNDLIPVGSGWQISSAVGINNKGQIAANGERNGLTRALLLTPNFRAFVQQPIHADGSSVFSAKRGIVPVKFAVTKYGKYASCALPATISVTRAARGTLTPVDENTYSKAEETGSNFRITGCRYHYNLPARSLGVGTYRVDMSIKGIMVGHAVFTLK
jgi:probable HAF family extracellular repeat protein